MLLDLFWIVLIIHTCTAKPLETFVCVNDVITLTVSDCQRMGSDSSSCYLDTLYSQYRPCAEVCHGKLVNTLDDERCRYTCPDFIQEYCVLSSQVKTTSTSPSTPSTEPESQVADIPRAGLSKGESANKAGMPNWLIWVLSFLFGGICVVTLATVSVKYGNQLRNKYTVANDDNDDKQAAAGQQPPTDVTTAKHSVPECGQGVQEGIGSICLTPAQTYNSTNGCVENFETDHIERPIEGGDPPDAHTDFTTNRQQEYEENQGNASRSSSPNLLTQLLKSDDDHSTTIA